MKLTIIQFIGYARKFLIALSAALAILVVALTDNIVTPSEWIQIALAFLASVGVYATKNEELK